MPTCTPTDQSTSASITSPDTGTSTDVAESTSCSGSEANVTINFTYSLSATGSLSFAAIDYSTDGGSSWNPTSAIVTGGNSDSGTANQPVGTQNLEDIQIRARVSVAVSGSSASASTSAWDLNYGGGHRAIITGDD